MRVLIRPIGLIGAIGLIGFFILAAPLLVSAEHGSLVPKCGTIETVSEGAPTGETVRTYYPCDTCHLFDLLKHTLDFIWKWIAIPVVALMITYGGILLIIPSSGSLERGKKIIINALFGLLIVFSAWLIIDTIIKVIAQQSVLSQTPAEIGGYGPWNSFTCTKIEPIRTTLGPAAPAAPALPDQSPDSPAPHLDDATARSQLTGVGIQTVSSGGCTDQRNPSCTSLQGLPQVAVEELSRMQAQLKTQCPSCSLVITGGTEVGHQAHGPGKAIVDISSKSTEVNNFIRGLIGVQAPKINTWYKGGDNHYYFYESDHWHVCLTSSCAPHKVQSDQVRGL